VVTVGVDAHLLGAELDLQQALVIEPRDAGVEQPVHHRTRPDVLAHAFDQRLERALAAFAARQGELAAGAAAVEEGRIARPLVEHQLQHARLGGGRIVVGLAQRGDLLAVDAGEHVEAARGGALAFADEPALGRRDVVALHQLVEHRVRHALGDQQAHQRGQQFVHRDEIGLGLGVDSGRGRWHRRRSPAGPRRRKRCVRVAKLSTSAASASTPVPPAPRCQAPSFTGKLWQIVPLMLIRGENGHRIARPTPAPRGWAGRSSSLLFSWFPRLHFKGISMRIRTFAVLATALSIASAASAQGINLINLRALFKLPTAAELAAAMQNSTAYPAGAAIPGIAPATGSSGSSGTCGSTFSASSGSNNGSGSSVFVSASASYNNGQCSTSQTVVVKP
jgi:hypothetical protein